MVVRHQLAVLIVATILVAFTTTTIGLILYNTGGAAQVDLSRPGYAGLSEELESDKDHSYIEFPATGPIDSKTLQEFEDAYKVQLDNSVSIDAFSGSPLSAESLGIDEARVRDDADGE